MATPKPALSPPPAGYDERSAIGEVTVLVFDMKPGQSEIRVRFPSDALAGARGASAKQAAFRDLVMDELGKALGAFSRGPSA